MRVSPRCRRRTAPAAIVNTKSQTSESTAAREIYRKQTLDGFGFDVEVLYIASHLGYRTLEVPVRWNDVAGTKVSMWLGAKGFWDPVRVRWNGARGKYR